MKTLDLEALKLEYFASYALPSEKGHLGILFKSDDEFKGAVDTWIKGKRLFVADNIKRKMYAA